MTIRVLHNIIKILYALYSNIQTRTFIIELRKNAYVRTCQKRSAPRVRFFACSVVHHKIHIYRHRVVCYNVRERVGGRRCFIEKSHRPVRTVRKRVIDRFFFFFFSSLLPPHNVCIPVDVLRSYWLYAHVIKNAAHAQIRVRASV